MQPSTYGSVMWDDRDSVPYESSSSSATGLGLLAGAGLLSGVASTTQLKDGTRPIDYLSAVARTGGNLSPMQLLNTFRVPEFLSPFTSTQYKTGGQQFQGATYWDKQFLRSESTYDWLKYSTGMDKQGLEAAGIVRGMDDDGLADALLFDRDSGRGGRGKLWSVRGGEWDDKANKWLGGQRTLLSDQIQLMATSQEITNPFSGNRGLNRAAVGVIDAADLYRSNPKFKPRSVFRTIPVGEAPGVQPAFIPMPSVTGSFRSVEDLKRRTNYVRGFSAFSMDRFNRLMSDATEQFLGKDVAEGLGKLTGLGKQVAPGPASSQFARFGFRAMGAGALYLGVQQIDWGRRNFSLPGEIAASTAVSAGLAYGLGKLGVGPRASAMAGVASFFGQMVMPGFDQGVIQGLATTAVNADIMRANAANPFSYLRRTMEGFAPGFTSWETGALFAISAAAATSINLPRAGGGTLAHSLLRQVTPSRLGLSTGSMSDGEFVRAVGDTTKSVRSRFWQNLSHRSGGGTGYETLSQRYASVSRFWDQQKAKGDTLGFFRGINESWHKAEFDMRDVSKSNPLNHSLERRFQKIANTYGGTDLISSVQRNALGFGAQAYHSFFGANLGVDDVMRERIKDMGFGFLKSSGGGFKIPVPTGRWGRLLSVGAAAFGIHQVASGGALGSMDTADELRNIYAGKKLVEVQKSRWWEAGSQPFQGAGTAYYRQHQYHLMMNRVREKGIWGDEEDSVSPIGKWFRRNFTYDLERQQYYDRPYPISSAAFSDVPIIGGVLASTIGKIVKPAKLMHASEWMRPGADGIEYASIFEGDRFEGAVSLGYGKGVPDSPYSAAAQMSFLNYQYRELGGFVGYAANTLQKMVSGTDVWGADTPLLADSGLMDSNRRTFWEQQMGGALFSNELIRRIFPSYRSDIERRNPIYNTMPSWLPQKYRTGDPYTSVEWGEARLPGSGYAALHPELRGVDPEAYPLIHRYAILSDVSPLSSEYSRTKQMVYEQRQAGSYTPSEQAYIDELDRVHSLRTMGHRDRRTHANAISLPGSGITSIAWQFGQRQLRNFTAPAEYITPMGFRPVHKLMGLRDSIEQYEHERMYGSAFAFWDKPMRDWFRPAALSAAHLAGFDGKPGWRKEADRVNAHYDKLEFVKWHTLAQQAAAQGDHAAANRYRYRAGSTRAGVNPQGSPLAIYWTLPDSERKFFNAFAHAQGSDRNRIEQMVPDDQIHLYRAVWDRMDSGETIGMADGGSDSQYQMSQFEDAVASIGGVPPANWVGMNPDVDMNDIRVRYVQNQAAELSDYGLWESQLRQSMQQPFLEGAEQIASPDSVGTLRQMVPRMTGVNGNRGSWQIVRNNGMMSSTSIDFNDDRSYDISQAVERYINAY